MNSHDQKSTRSADLRETVVKHVHLTIRYLGGTCRSVEDVHSFHKINKKGMQGALK